MQVGEMVTWTSQSQGCTKTKRGEVVAIVPAGESPNRPPYIGYKPLVNPGMARNHESYIVVCKGKTYWPRVSVLEPVGRSEVTDLRDKLERARRLLSLLVIDSPEDLADLEIVMKDADTTRILGE
ncbi:hypothetical protein M0R72_12675 [Candidatus Pacearchaeota archaeon]|jgi:hypothetical protein|nr:hypothetical protein [Candidatus Pacearchaeota archaeon]